MLIAPKDKAFQKALYSELMTLEDRQLVQWLTAERDRLRELNELEQSEPLFRQIQGGLRMLTALLKTIAAARETLTAIEKRDGRFP